MKGTKMKDKITVGIVCAFCIGMYWISRTTSITSEGQTYISEEAMPSGLKDSTMDFIDYETPETTFTDETNLHSEISSMNTCTLKSIDTDALNFGEAFGYYRKCLGSDSSFYWDGNEYTTHVSEEVIIQLADSIKVEDNSKEPEISQTH